MATSIIFNFADTVRYSYELKKNIIFHIEKTTESIARLYFTDEHNSLIEKPTTFHIESDNNEDFVMEKPIDNNYYLCWCDNYTITYDQKKIMNIDSQRTWNITHL